jgi:hypothetical protein
VFGSPGEGVEGMSVANVGNEIIAALGFDNFVGDTMFTRIYNIASNSWSYGMPAPGTSSEGAGVSHGGLFYNVGGRFIGPRNDLWSYMPALDIWTVLAPMPTARAGLGVAVVDNTIFAIGGRTGTSGPGNGGVLATVEAYDVDTNTWSTVAPLPPPARSDLAAISVAGQVFAIGGIDAAGNFLNNVDVYDPITDTWSTAPADMPTARAAFYAVAVKGGTIYAIGGWAGGPPLSTNESYKVASDTWTAGLLPMPTPRAETGAVGHGGRVYIVGGAQPAFGASVDKNEVFKP